MFDGPDKKAERMERGPAADLIASVKAIVEYHCNDVVLVQRIMNDLAKVLREVVEKK